MGFTIKMEMSDDMLDVIAEKIISKGTVEKYIEEAIDEKIYTAHQVADKLHMTVESIWSHIREGVLIAHRPGKSYLITQTNLNNYIHGRNL